MKSIIDYSFLKNKPFYHKFIIFLMIFLSLYLLIPIIFLLFSLPFVGKEVIDNLQGEAFYSNVTWLKIMQLVTQVGVFAGTAFLFARLNTKKTFDFLFLTKKPHFSIYLFSVVALLFSMPLVSVLMKMNQQIHFPENLQWIETSLRNQELASEKMMDLFLKVSSIEGLLFNLLLIAIVPAICEELLFRGALQRILIERTKNIHVSVLISAILFSALHMQFFSFFPRLILGLVIGYAVAYGMSLKPAIVAHAINNGISVVSAYLFYNGYITSDYHDVGSSSNIWIIVFSTICSVLLIFFLYKKSLVSKKTVHE